MKGRSALATMFACLLLTHTVSVAWAQDEEEESTTEEAGEAGEEAAAEGEEAAEEAGEAVEDATEEGDAAAAGRWPSAVIARPLTLPKSLARLGAAITANNDFSIIGLGLNAGYGISDKIDVNVTYGLTLKEFEAKGDLNASLGYSVLTGSAGGKLDVAVRAGTGYNVLGETIDPLVIGGDIRYKINDKLAIISPPSHLNIALDGDIKPIYLSLPVGAAYQVSPQLYASLTTNIGNIEIKDAASVFIFADFLPITATGIYNVKPNLDAYVSVFTDLKNEPGDTLAFVVGANYYMGAL